MQSRKSLLTQALSGMGDGATDEAQILENPRNPPNPSDSPNILPVDQQFLEPGSPNNKDDATWRGYRPREEDWRLSPSPEPPQQ